MMKKILVLLSGVLFAWCAWAVDVNTATQAGLESVKGIGPKMATSILDARKKGGAFKNTQDLVTRVPGIGEKRVEKLQAAGLTIGAGSVKATVAEKIDNKKK